MEKEIIRDRFELESVVAETRYLSIYRALDTASGPDGRRRRVLLWLFGSAIEDERAIAAMRSRFARLASLVHANIAGIYELSNDGNRYFAIGEYVEAETLRTVLENLAPERLDAFEVDEVLTAVASGLVYAHDHGVTHGDVRVENILVTTESEIKLASFMAVPSGAGTYNASVDDDVRDLAALAFELYAGAPYRSGSDAPMEAIPARRREALKAVLEGSAGGNTPHTVREFMSLAGLADRQSGGAAADLPLAEPIYVPPQRLEPVPARQGRGWTFGIAALVLVAAVVGLGRWHEPILNRLDAVSAALVPDTDPSPSERQGVGTLAALDVESAAEAGAAAAGLPRAETPTDPETPAVNAAVIEPEPAAPEAQLQDAGALEDAELAGAELEDSAVPDVQTSPAMARDARPKPVVSLASSTETAFESQGKLTVHAEFVGERDGPIEIVWWTSDGSALAGDDYASFGRLVERVSSEQSTLDLYIPLTEDVISEPHENFFVHIEAATDDVALGAITRAEVTVIDDDS